MIPASSRKTQPFLQPTEQLFPILIRYGPAFMQGIMMTERAIRIRVSVQHHGFLISRPDMDMKMRIGIRILIKAVHQAAPIAQSRSQNRLETGLCFADQHAKLVPFILCQLRQRTAVTLQNQNASPDIILFICKENRPACTLVQLKPFVLPGQIAPAAILHLFCLRPRFISAVRRP